MVNQEAEALVREFAVWLDREGTMNNSTLHNAECWLVARARPSTGRAAELGLSCICMGQAIDPRCLAHRTEAGR